MITDGNGDELVYWPISGLIEGEVSETLDFTVDVPDTVAFLYGTADDRVRVWVRKVGDIAFTDISATPYDLSVVSAGPADFQAYVEALTPIVGLERVPLTIVAGTSSRAGWVA